MFSGQIFQDWSFWTISSEANHCIGCKSGHHLVPLALSYCPIYQLILCRSHGYYVNTNTKCPWRITKNYDSLLIPKTQQEGKGVDRLGECGVSRIGGRGSLGWHQLLADIHTLTFARIPTTRTVTAVFTWYLFKCKKKVFLQPWTVLMGCCCADLEGNCWQRV